MRKILAVAFAIPLFAACTVGEDAIGGDGDEHEDPPPDNTPPTGDGIEGMIMQDATWSGVTRIKAETTIPAGVTVTVAAGATLNYANNARIVVAGTLRVEGTAAGKVVMQSEQGATYWGPLSVTGTLDVKYGDFIGGAISTSGAAASLVLTDTKMFRASGDYIIMNGGTINMTYSQIGANTGETDTTHCNLHLNAASSITVTNSNIATAPYGNMFYGGVNANMQNNNWYGNGKDIDTASGVSGNVSGGWFEKGAPVAGPGAMLTAQNLSPTRLANAGPRP